MALGDAVVSTQIKTWDQVDFSGGLDLRWGAVSDQLNSQRIRKNLRSGKGKNPVRRPPCLDVGGDASAATQGLLIYGGRFYVFGKRGDVITHTGGVLSLVTELLFDAPEYTGAWELIEYGVHESAPWALIRHEGDAGRQTFLHVWDGLLYEPTYVLDPEFPGSYSNGPDDLAGQIYSPDFTGAAAVAVSKLWVSNPGGNVQCCRTADARVWNQRDEASLKVDGEHYCFRVPGGAGGLRSFAVPRPAADLALDGRWAYYVLEKAVGSAWVPLEEVAGIPGANDTWAPASAPRWDAPDRIVVQIRWPSPDSGLIRLRLVAGSTNVEIVGNKPAVTITGAGLTRTLSIGPSDYRYRGGDKVSDPGAEFTISQGRSYLVAVGPGTTGLWDLAGGFPSGWEREKRRIIQKIVWGAAETEPNYTTITGTVAVVIGNPGITGTATKFLTELEVDNYVLINGERKKVTALASNLAATAESNFAANAGPVSIMRWTDPAYLYAYEIDVDSQWFTEILLDYIDRAGAEDAVTIASRTHDRKGGLVSAIGEQFNRLIVCYPESIQSWSVDQATNATAHLATLNFGTGAQQHPSPVPFYEAVAVALDVTERAVYVSGVNNDTLKDNNIGEKLEGLPFPQVRSACHWPDLGELVVAGTRLDGSTVFLALDYSKESKIDCWNEWDVVGLGTVDLSSLQPSQKRLYFRSGTKIRYFDGEATLFRDAGEVEGNAFLSDMLTPLNQFKQPNTVKAMKYFDINQVGACNVSFEFAQVADVDGYNAVGPVLDNRAHAGPTFGIARRPLTGASEAIAVRLQSRSERGWELRQFALTYQYKKR